MNFVSGFAGIYIVLAASCAVAQVETEARKTWGEDRLRRGVSPEREESYRLPALDHEIRVLAQPVTTSIRAYEPLILNVRLTNRDTRPLRLEVRDDGLPYGIASVVTQPDGGILRLHQWLVHSEASPPGHDVTLGPGESTTGELLIIFGGPPTGVAFPVPGTYTVQCACQPDGRFAPVMSNEVRISVGKASRRETDFFSELRALSIWYYGTNEEYLIEREGEEIRQFEFGLNLLRRFIRETKPGYTDPERDPADEKTAELLESVATLVERYPDSAYSGCLARFLGLVHLHAFGREIGRETARAWHETGKGPTWKSEELRGRASYQKALRYLTKANEGDLWPRTAVPANLASLHTLAQEWNESEKYLVILREKCADFGGPEMADRLETRMSGARKRAESDKSTESPGP